MKNKKPVIFLTFANDKVDDALYLRNLPFELHNIREALQPAVQAGLCEVVERTAATIDQIFDIFQDPYYKDRIAVYHYGGHASGTQLMFENLDGSHGSSNSEGLVPFFGKQKGLKLVFINGCSSQQQATEMIEAGIPAVVGTATAIKDQVATELSKRFYSALAGGLTIDQSWQQAIDSVKTKTSTKKTKGLKLRRDKGSNFPWNMYIRQGSEIVKEWNLPTAVNNPLFGLPSLPRTFNLPEDPFRFLQRYKEEHAEVFFGRGRYIRDLYNRSTDEHAAPVILLYGQSGVGKSSLLDAGVLPRLQRENQVSYIRRDFEIGMLNSLRSALDLPIILPKKEVEATAGNVTDEATGPSPEEILQEKIAPLQALLPTLAEDLKEDVQEAIDRIIDKHRQEQRLISSVGSGAEKDYSPEHSIILQRWKAIEEETGEPLIIILDQVEEVFTKEHPDIEDELDEFFSEMNGVFDSITLKPKGRMILSYRKEFHSEVEEACKTHEIPREQIFLKPLEKEDIEAVILGLTTTPKLEKRYDLKIEKNLPEIIADDLLEDKDSAISPVLQILLTKLWNMALEERDENAEHNMFTIDNYQQLKKQGILMDDFFYQQMNKLKEWQPEIVESGLALDVLNYHTSKLGSASVQHLDDIRTRYAHQQDKIDKLIVKLKDLYLLTDAGVGRTGLAHDSIAPLIRDLMRTSDTDGQRASRILTNKVPSYEAYPETIIDADDLQLVEDGVNGMRLWTLKEQELIDISRKKRARDRRRMFIIRMMGVAALVMIIALSGIAVNKMFEAQKERRVAQRERKNALAEKTEAIRQKGIADEKTVEANEQREIAIEQQGIAEEQTKVAIYQKGIAEQKTIEAKENADEAIKQKGIAEEKTELANKETERAEANEKEAKENADEAFRQKDRADEKTREVQRKLSRERSITKAGNAEDKARLDDFEPALDLAVEAYKALQASYNPANDDHPIPSAVYNSLNSVYEAVSNDIDNNVFVGHPNMARDLEFNKETDRVAFSTFTAKKVGQVYLIKNEAKGSRNRQILPVDEEVRTIRFSPNGSLLLAGTIDGRIFGWDYNGRSGKYEKFQVFEEGHPFAPTLLGQEDYNAKNAILSIAFASPPHKRDIYYLAICHPKGYSIYEVDKSGKILEEIQHEDRRVEYCMFSEKGKYFTVMDSRGAHVMKYNIRDDGKKKWQKYQTVRLNGATECSFSHDENLIALGNKRGYVAIYNLSKKTYRYSKATHKGKLTALKFSPDDSKLITSSLDHTVKLYDIEDIYKNKRIADPITLLGSSAWVWDICFSKNQKYIYAISQDNTVRKWPTDLDELYKNLEKAKKEKLYLKKQMKRSN